MQMRTFRILFFNFAVLFLAVSCASNFDSDLKKIRVGDNKSQVLEILGNPRRTSRYKDTDRWTYTYLKDDVDHVQNIDFQNGKVIKIAEKTSNEADINPENFETYEEYEKSVIKSRRKK